MTSVRTRRIHDGPDGGVRVLVDRLWPRGVSKEAAQLDAWVREVAPSDELRRWFDHDPAKWDEFRRRFHAELDARPDAVARLRELAGDGELVLVFAARDGEHCNAAALLEYLLQRP